jgi:8-oxo-dGTP pyrophosphatase MutT (NUDIX family)
VAGEVVDQRSPHAAAGAARMNRYLLDVQIAVDNVGDEVADGGIGGIRGNPGTAGSVVTGEYVEGQGFIVGYLRHAHSAETFAGGAFDVLQERQLSLANHADAHRAIVPRRDDPAGALRCRPPSGTDGWQNAPVSISAEGVPEARIVTALLRDGDRILLCHRSPRRRWYPDVWDLPGGHVEAGELPGVALARELREELGIDIAAPSGPPVQEVHADTIDMQIWLIEAWTGSPVNAAPDERDAITWFTEDALGELSLGQDSYLAMFRRVLARNRERSHRESTERSRHDRPRGDRRE